MRIVAVIGFSLIVLGGCAQTPPPANTRNAGYGAAEFDRDQKQCNAANSKTVVISGYDQTSTVVVDKDKANACLKEKGWQVAG